MRKSKIMKLGVVMAVAFLFVGTAQAKTLSVGSSGSLVSDLQAWLIEGGYPIPSIDSGAANPGYFGSQTLDAVKMYQEEKGLATTGVIDSSVFQRSEVVRGMPGLDNSPYLSLGGVQIWTSKVPMLSASTTVCNMQSPAATSTLLSAPSVGIIVGTTSEAAYQIAVSSVPSATTTVIASQNVPATIAMQIFATTSPGRVIPGNSWIVVKASPTVGTASAGTLSNTGFCAATFVTGQY